MGQTSEDYYRCKYFYDRQTAIWRWRYKKSCPQTLGQINYKDSRLDRRRSNINFHFLSLNSFHFYFRIEFLFPNVRLINFNFSIRILRIALSNFNFLLFFTKNKIHKRYFRGLAEREKKNQFRACHEQSFLWRSLRLTCWGWLCRRMSVSSCFTDENKKKGEKNPRSLILKSLSRWESLIRKGRAR